ncbi:MAG: sulfatase-like hydrolase/transferase [Verrucomicrobiota bacterium]
MRPLLSIFAFVFLSVMAEAKPNIVFIITDDMGYADISSFGAPDLKTPHIDQLAKEGVKFTNIYAMGPECTPSRVSYLTGRYPQRVGGMECAIGTGNVGRYDDAIRLAEKGNLGLPADYAVLAPALKRAGYQNALFGKWHLGYEPKFSPLKQGFDEFVGFLGGNVDYFRHRELSDIEVYLSGNEPITREGYTTDLITEDAIAFIEKQAQTPDQPFFLYLPHAAPHFPFQGPDDDDGGLPSEDEWTLGSRETYIEMMESLDASVGAVVGALAEHDLTESTLIVFTSDHGAMKPGLNSPWRDYKGTLFEGGIRVPLIAKWPGVLRAGRESAQVGSLMDLTGSFLNAAGAKLPQGLALDGDDLIEHVRTGGKDYRRSLFWRARRGDRTWKAVRHGDWKYLYKIEGGETSEWLFQLASDPHEKKNLLAIEKHKKTLEMLKAKLVGWEKKVAHKR